MRHYLLTRLLKAGGMLVGVTLLSYLLIYLAPADPAQVIAAQRLGGQPNPAQVAWVRQEYGLDRPWFLQYARWLTHILQGDLGVSIRTGHAIRTEIRHALHYSLVLAGWSTAFVVLVGGLSGVWAALQRYSLMDRLIQLIGLVCVSIPEFWLAFLFILVFAINLGWLPSYGARSHLHLILPVLSLGLGQAARLSRLTRTLLLQEMHQSYLRTACAKGRSHRSALLRHGLPNIAVPLVTLLTQQLGLLLGGAILMETLFTWPGVGAYFITAVHFRDIPVIQAMVLLFATIMISLHLLADLSYGWLDPRLRLAS